MKNILIGTLFTLISTHLFAFDDHLSCPEGTTSQSVGEMILDADFSGMRYFHEGESDCLAQENFPHIRVIADPPQEAIEDYYHYELIQRDGSFAEVKRIESLDSEMGLYRIHFEVEARSSRTGNRSVLNDTMTYTFYPSERMRERNGCGGMIAAPNRYYLKPSCLPSGLED